MRVKETKEFRIIPGNLQKFLVFPFSPSPFRHWNEFRLRILPPWRVITVYQSQIHDSSQEHVLKPFHSEYSTYNEWNWNFFHGISNHSGPYLSHICHSVCGVHFAHLYSYYFSPLTFVYVFCSTECIQRRSKATSIPTVGAVELL